MPNNAESVQENRSSTPSNKPVVFVGIHCFPAETYVCVNLISTVPLETPSNAKWRLTVQGCDKHDCSDPHFLLSVL